MKAFPLLLLGGAAIYMMSGKKKSKAPEPEPEPEPEIGPGSEDPRWGACESKDGTMKMVNGRGVCVLPNGAQIDGWKIVRGEVSPGKHVTIFTASWCGACSSLKEDLYDAGIPFSEVDIESDEEGAAFVESKGGMIPMTTVGEDLFIGAGKLEAIQKARS